MPLLNKLKQYLRPSRREESEPAAAYDIWSQNYDNQPDNLMLVLDNTLVGKLLQPLSLTGKVIVDVGCGTGRHWGTLFNQSPARLLGYDVSAGMLDILQKKYPRAETFLLSGPTLTGLETASCDFLLSTLTIAHIPDLVPALTEWCRVLKPGGHLIITENHPTALAKGGQRTFRDGNNVIAVRNYIYPISRVQAITRQLGLEEVSLTETAIDESMRPYYEKQNALAVYQRFLGVPIIYGIHLKKPDVAQ